MERTQTNTVTAEKMKGPGYCKAESNSLQQLPRLQATDYRLTGWVRRDESHEFAQIKFRQHSVYVIMGH